MMAVTIDGTTGIDKVQDGSIVYADLNSNIPLGTKNRIINGDMRIAQRGTSFSNPTGGLYTLDRWYIRTQNASVVSTITQSTTAPTGFINSFYLSIGTGAASGSTDRAQLYHGLEGLNVSDFGWGTANAKTVTLSFWVRSSLTGQFGGAIQNGAGNRSYPFTYTISSANTWEQKTVTVAGDTTGTWTTDNGLGIQLNFDLGAGSSFLTTAGSWAAGDYRGATGDTSIVATSGATWYITGCQLEASTEATPFENRMYGTELALCQRYYWKPEASNKVFGSGYVVSATRADMFTSLPVSMRASPSIVNTAVSIRINYAAVSVLATTITLLTSTTTNFSAYITGASGLTVGQGVTVSNNGVLELSAEL